jgi:hypothetical protein
LRPVKVALNIPSREEIFAGIVQSAQSGRDILERPGYDWVVVTTVQDWLRYVRAKDPSQAGRG